MKYKWKCRYQICPAPENVIFFNSLEEVNRFVRDIISKHVDLSSYIEELKSYGNYKYFFDRAEFLKRYIEDPSFPSGKADFPLESPEDYDDEPYIKECFDEFEDFDLSEERLVLDNAEIDFRSDFVLPDPNSFYSFYNGEMRVSFNEQLDILIVQEQEEWEPSAYPIMVLKVLSNAADVNESLSQEEIGEMVGRDFFDYDYRDVSSPKTLHRNIVGRIIKMLRNLGFTITRSKEGYLLDRSCMNESPSIKEGSFGSKANSVMVLLVLQSADLPLTRGEIAEKIKERFHHKIDVKTVGRNVELLQDLEYKIKKFGNKGCLLQK